MSLGTVIVFARAPRLGVGKRRLAADIGRLPAWRFYRRNLGDLLRRLRGGPWRLEVAVSSPAEQAHPFFAGHSVWPQVAGDLGRRMSAALRQARPGPAIVIGSDIPGIDKADMRTAFAALGRSDAVFGPAPDGGYWLVGLARRKPIPAEFMRHVRWSSRHALTDTVASMPHDWRVAALCARADVDDGLSYRRYRAVYGAP